MERLLNNKQVLFFCALSLCGSVFSAVVEASTFYSGKFYCSVQQYQKFNKNVLSNDEKMLKNLFGNEKNRFFVVDAKTGEVNGMSISNTSFDTLVIDDGRQEGQSVKILWRSRAGYIHAAYLEIHRYVEATEKPFVLVKDSSVISGTCQ